MAAREQQIANRFSHHFCVTESDIDDLGHAGNVAWVRWVNEAATAHSHAVGLDLAAYRALGLLWVVRRHDIEYLHSALHGDQLIASTWIASSRGATCERDTEFRHGERVLARARTTWAMVRIPSGRPTRIPKDLLGRYGFKG